MGKIEHCSVVGCPITNSVNGAPLCGGIPSPECDAVRMLSAAGSGPELTVGATTTKRPHVDASDLHTPDETSSEGPRFGGYMLENVQGAGNLFTRQPGVLSRRSSN